ncbi:MAG: hypothetical protein ABSC02_10160 [Acidobacteriota bacterium]|jgi:hypothetical protein
MSLSPQVFPSQSERAGKFKYLYYRSTSTEPQDYRPCLYLEARIDYADIRSGYQWTTGISDVLDLFPLEGDLLWTSDMVRTVDPAALQVTRPEGVQLGAIPEFVSEGYLSRAEAQYMSYLLRRAEALVYRNFALNIYSNPGESQADFLSRCLDACHESFRHDLETLREVVNRRLERIEKKFIVGYRPAEFESDRGGSQARNKLHAVAERIAEIFLRTELALEGEADLPRYSDQSPSDLEDRLMSLETDVSREIQRLQNSYLERVRNIDEYIIHPNLKDLHLVRTCILWLPEGALAP